MTSEDRRIVEQVATCQHDWYLDFSGHVLMHRCHRCPAALPAKSRA